MIAGPEQVIAGKYRLLKKLGQGAMGSVWAAEHLTLRSYVAVKLIEPAIAQSQEALSRFLREAQAAAALRSPHVVQILDHGVDGETPYIVMELLEGESLADRLARVGRLSPPDAARLLTQIARAVGRAHEAGIVHRDLKPDNVYLVRNDDEEVAKVLDFGIAKANAQGGFGSAGGGTRTGLVLGTPYYMSPEQAEGMKDVDATSDIWALGVIAFECILGRRPFEAESLGTLVLAICTRPMPIPSAIGPVPPGFDEWFARACSRDRSLRFATARDAAAELRRVSEGVPLSASSSGAFPGQPSDPHARTVVAPAQSGIGGFGGSVTGVSAASQGLSTSGVQKSPGPGLAIGIGLAVVVLGGGALGWILLRSPSSLHDAASSATAEPSAAAHVAAMPSQTSVVAAPSPPAPVTPSTAVDVNPLPSSLPPETKPSAPSAVVAAPGGARHKPVSGAGTPPKPAPTAPAAPAPKPKPPEANPNVNLGI